MTTLEFTAWRVAALKYYLRHRFGRSWQRYVSRELGLKYPKDVFRYTNRPTGKFSTLVKIETVAVKYGWNPAGPLSLMRPPPTATLLPPSESRATE